MDIKFVFSMIIAFYIVFAIFRMVYYYFQDQNPALLREKSFFNKFGYVPYPEKLMGGAGFLTHEFRDVWFIFVVFLCRFNFAKKRVKKEELDFIASWPECYTFYLKKKTKSAFFDFIAIFIIYIIFEAI